MSASEDCQNLEICIISVEPYMPCGRDNGIFHGEKDG